MKCWATLRRWSLHACGLVRLHFFLWMRVSEGGYSQFSSHSIATQLRTDTSTLIKLTVLSYLSETTAASKIQMVFITQQPALTLTHAAAGAWELNPRKFYARSPLRAIFKLMHAWWKLRNTRRINNLLVTLLHNTVNFIGSPLARLLHAFMHVLTNYC